MIAASFRSNKDELRKKYYSQDAARPRLRAANENAQPAPADAPSAARGVRRDDGQRAHPASYATTTRIANRLTSTARRCSLRRAFGALKARAECARAAELAAARRSDEGRREAQKALKRVVERSAVRIGRRALHKLARAAERSKLWRTTLRHAAQGARRQWLACAWRRLVRVSRDARALARQSRALGRVARALRKRALRGAVAAWARAAASARARSNAVAALFQRTRRRLARRAFAKLGRTGLAKALAKAEATCVSAALRQLARGKLRRWKQVAFRRLRVAVDDTRLLHVKALALRRVVAAAQRRLRRRTFQFLRPVLRPRDGRCLAVRVVARKLASQRQRAFTYWLAETRLFSMRCAALARLVIVVKRPLQRQVLRRWCGWCAAEARRIARDARLRRVYLAAHSRTQRGGLARALARLRKEARARRVLQRLATMHRHFSAQPRLLSALRCMTEHVRAAAHLRRLLRCIVARHTARTARHAFALLQRRAAWRRRVEVAAAALRKAFVAVRSSRPRFASAARFGQLVLAFATLVRHSQRRNEMRRSLGRLLRARQRRAFLLLVYRFTISGALQCHAAAALRALGVSISRRAVFASFRALRCSAESQRHQRVVFLVRAHGLLKAVLRGARRRALSAGFRGIRRRAGRVCARSAATRSLARVRRRGVVGAAFRRLNALRTARASSLTALRRLSRVCRGLVGKLRRRGFEALCRWRWQCAALAKVLVFQKRYAVTRAWRKWQRRVARFNALSQCVSKAQLRTKRFAVAQLAWANGVFKARRRLQAIFARRAWRRLCAATRRRAVRRDRKWLRQRLRRGVLRRAVSKWRFHARTVSLRALLADAACSLSGAAAELCAAREIVDGDWAQLRRLALTLLAYHWRDATRTAKSTRAALRRWRRVARRLKRCEDLLSVSGRVVEKHALRAALLDWHRGCGVVRNDADAKDADAATDASDGARRQEASPPAASKASLPDSPTLPDAQTAVSQHLLEIFERDVVYEHAALMQSLDVALGALKARAYRAPRGGGPVDVHVAVADMAVTVACQAASACDAAADCAALDASYALDAADLARAKGFSQRIRVVRAAVALAPLVQRRYLDNVRRALKRWRAADPRRRRAATATHARARALQGMFGLRRRRQLATALFQWQCFWLMPLPPPRFDARFNL
ncbi:hypothetical protein M885DRAFT_610170 [Pelagophyceae sp. CCMP2097]|nr:hypothetical protein M885DRAFT_610170 [Pelagophyceae sp. CCMP2097]